MTTISIYLFIELNKYIFKLKYLLYKYVAKIQVWKHL